MLVNQTVSHDLFFASVLITTAARALNKLILQMIYVLSTFTGQSFQSCSYQLDKVIHHKNTIRATQRWINADSGGGEEGGQR